MAKKVKLSDIAASLGVSKTLVSLVINNKADAHGISKQTQQKVREKVLEMNFQPNVLARGFRTGVTKTIGLIVSDISNLFYSRIARRIEDYAWNQGYSVVICSTEENIEKEEAQIRLLRNRKVDGLIISSSMQDASYFNQLFDAGVPHVLIDRTFPGMKSANVSVDNFGGARLAARHLLSQGFRKIATIGITPEHISTINERIGGFQSELDKQGITIPDEWIIKAPFNNIEEAVKENLNSLHHAGILPDAIFTLNNNLTSLCLKYLGKLSVSVPSQVALVGFDDVLYFDFTRPSVSAVEQPVDLISKRAFDLLLKQIQGTPVPPGEWSVMLPVDLIVRESSVRFMKN
ncbi:MAG: LacI family transcriptional [Bacteroidetes bacterium]|nr:MAG: LacI family transcriptional [Bacteroidota bacterium]